MLIKCTILSEMQCEVQGERKGIKGCRATHHIYSPDKYDTLREQEPPEACMVPLSNTST